jgi:hypothetical protein
LLQRLHGSSNIASLSESSSELEEAGAGKKVIDAGNLQVKALADKAKQITQQKNSFGLSRAWQRRRKRCVMRQSRWLKRLVLGRLRCPLNRLHKI